MKLLENIKSPSDLKSLSSYSLVKLAEEIRALIVEVISINGGHLASSLGAVELAISLHYSFDTPCDKIVWDVGHQAYAHKIITGRAKVFHTIRKYGGLSGFPDRSESIYDHFGTGHASTSISAALGIAEAMRKSGKSNFSIAVIGDGSLTGGLAFEALNHAGHIHAKNLIVVLNDNNMSIDPNVGALQRFLNRRMNIAFYNRFRNEVTAIIKSLNSHGFFLKELISKIRKSIKMIFTPEMLYECLGFRYFGPVDGHNIDELIKVFSSIKNNVPDGPYFIHALTKKGKGFEPAEKLPLKYHGVSPFKVENGISKVNIKNYQDIFAETLIKLAEKDKRIIAITAAMPTGTGLNLFQEKFPDRFYDVGIAEEHAVTLAAGFATEGYKPVVAIYSTFLQRAFDQIIHDVALQNLPVIFAIDRAGLIGTDGATHQGQFDLTYLRVIPNITLMAPKDENELRHMIYTSLLYEKGPIAFRYPRGKVIGVKLEKTLKVLPIGKGEVLSADSEHVDVAMFVVGETVKSALVVQPKLRKLGIKSAVINARFIKPIDQDLIKKWALDSELVVTVEENSVTGGFGSAIIEYLQHESIQRKTLVIGIPDQFIRHGSQKLQKELLSLTGEGIFNKIAKELKLHLPSRYSCVSALDVVLGSTLDT